MRNRFEKNFVLLFALFACMTLLGCVTRNVSTAYNIEKETKKNNFSYLNERAEHHQVVFIGDSIIEIYNTTEEFPHINRKVYNRGISGDTSDRMVERLEENALNINPSTLVVLIGTNDLGRSLDFEFTLNNLKQTIQMAKAAKVPQILIQSIYPVNHSLNQRMVGVRDNELINQINKEIKALCETEGVTYVNIHDSLMDEGGCFNEKLTYDGLHPNIHGYEVITQILLEYIE